MVSITLPVLAGAAAGAGAGAWGGLGRWLGDFRGLLLLTAGGKQGNGQAGDAQQGK